MKHLLAVALVLLAGVVTEAQRVYSPDEAGVTLPTVVRIVKPEYTSNAMAQRIEGTVLLECVVRADGSVTDVAVIESLDATYGLDEEAIKAVRESEFRPGTLDGKPVAVRVRVMMSFTLK